MHSARPPHRDRRRADSSARTEHADVPASLERLLQMSCATLLIDNDVAGRIRRAHQLPARYVQSQARAVPCMADEAERALIILGNHSAIHRL